MAKSIENEICSIISSLATSLEAKTDEENAELISALIERFNDNERLYECEMNLSAINFAGFASIPYIKKYGVKDDKNEPIIEMIYTNIFPHFVRTIIERNEGSACSCDKESFVIARVLKAISTGENLSLYVQYKDCDTHTVDDAERQTYWSPTSFKDTDDVISKFWAWYNVE